MFAVERAILAFLGMAGSGEPSLAEGEENSTG